jgi:putative peptide zinc metalloprotease protein
MTIHVQRLILAAALAVALSAAPALAQEELDVGGGGDNTAVVVNTKDGSSKFKISFKILRTSSDTVDNTNAAIAFASCEGCETVAIAWQVVLVSSDPSVVSPENYAIALNVECTDCATLASAYQWVLGTDGKVRFTAEGNRAIAQIRRSLQELRRSDLTIVEVQAELDALAEELERILAEELVAAGPPEARVEQADDAEGDPDEPSPEPEASPTPGASPGATSPEPTPTAELSPTEKATPSPEVTAEASPTPSSTSPSP